MNADVSRNGVIGTMKTNRGAARRTGATLVELLRQGPVRNDAHRRRPADRVDRPGRGGPRRVRGARPRTRLRGASTPTTLGLLTGWHDHSLGQQPQVCGAVGTDDAEAASVEGRASLPADVRRRPGRSRRRAPAEGRGTPRPARWRARVRSGREREPRAGRRERPPSGGRTLRARVAAGTRSRPARRPGRSRSLSQR
jgi:hypothetical protein